MIVRDLKPEDASAWLEMRSDLWPDADNADDVQAFLEHGPQPGYEAVLIAEWNGVRVGFAELSIRAYSPGCDTNRVAYLEGWYVRPQARGCGVGCALVRAAEVWAVSQGCTEFASDTELENVGSQHAHQALGFTEVERVVFYRKKLEETTSHTVLLNTESTV
jgi:aminoglycoside 6'-N-acetyltransferase I